MPWIGYGPVGNTNHPCMTGVPVPGPTQTLSWSIIKSFNQMSNVRPWHLRTRQSEQLVNGQTARSRREVMYFWLTVCHPHAHGPKSVAKSVLTQLWVSPTPPFANLQPLTTLLSRISPWNILFLTSSFSFSIAIWATWAHFDTSQN